MNEQYNTIEEAIEDLRAGKIILVTDDPDRENEGDMICAAEFATQANINFMASHAKGLICTPMSAELAAKLQANDDDDTVLKDLAQEGGTKLGNILSRVLGKTSYSWDENKTKIIFTTNAVSNFMETQKETIKDNMLSYLSYYTLAKWLNLIKPDEAPRFDNRLGEIEEELRLLGAQRDKPKRTSSEPTT